MYVIVRVYVNIIFDYTRRLGICPYRTRCMSLNKIAMRACAYNLLEFSFVGPLVLMVYPREVGHYHRDRKRYDQHAGQRTDATHEFTDHRLRNHVSIPGQA